MEPNSSADFKNKERVSYTENRSSKDGSCPNNGNQWQEHQRETRHDHGKNRERRDAEWSRGRAFNDKREQHFREDENRDRFREEQQQHSQTLPQQSTFLPPQPSYSYNTPSYTSSDQSYVDNNRHALAVMSTYGMIARLNSQWGVNPLETMTQNNVPVNPAPSSIPISSNMDINQNASTSGMNPFAFMGENNMYGMVGMGNYCQYGMMNIPENITVSPMKEIVHLSKSVIYPPNPSAPPPTTREKPLGCKTVFVGGLPEKITEEIVREVFEKCGEIQTIRMSKKNFCHIRFADESFVENALYFSGYRIKIENKDEAPFTGRLHVDYAQARNDEREYRIEIRRKEREARHRRRAEQEYCRPPTPPTVSHYTDHEAAVVSEKLRGEDTFQQALSVLITWLDRGECNKKTSGSFYSMIQSSHSHVRRLISEKLKYEDEVNKAKLMLKQQMQDILNQFSEIQKVFISASTQKVWDHFTKAQRKNIEIWKKQTAEIKNAHLDEFLKERSEEEMDLSDIDDGNENDNDSGTQLQASSAEQQKSELEENIDKLRDGNDTLRSQLAAAESENMVLRAELLEKERNESQFAAMRQVFYQNMRKELMNQRRSADENGINELRGRKKRNLDIDDGLPGCSTDHAELEENDFGLGTSSANSSIGNENDARLIGLISTFLHVHPMGANIDYICSFLCQIDGSIRSRDIERLMKRFPSVFKEESTGIGASLGKKWTFRGFMPSL